MLQVALKGLTVALLLAAGAQPTRAEEPSGRLALSDFARRFGLDLNANHAGELILTNAATRLTFSQNGRQAMLNGLLVYLNDSLSTHRAGWSLATVDVESVLQPILRPAPTNRPSFTPVVVLDPGHGGEDPGAHTPYMQEKRLALEIALQVRAELLLSGVTVILTRGYDRFLSLAERAALARQREADLFVSIHLNSIGHPRAQGIETFILPAADHPSTSNGTDGSQRCAGNAFDAPSMQLAYWIHKGLLHHSRAVDRGIKRARFEVLCLAPCPAVLVECGFISHPEEASRINTRPYRHQLARGIAQGILTTLHRQHPRPDTVTRH